MRDDDDAKNLLSPLDNAIPDSTVDMSELVRRGHRAVNTRRMIGASTATAVVVAGVVLAIRPVSPAVVTTEPSAGAAIEPPTSCSVHRLPLPPGAAEGRITDGEPGGRFLTGTADSPDGRVWTLLWDRGRLTALRPPTTITHDVVVNSAGVIAGSGMNEANVWISWRYENGKYIVLPQPGGQFGFVSVADINERGDILGTDNIIDSTEQGSDPQQPPLVWPHDDPAKYRQVVLPNGIAEAHGRAIDDAGAVLLYPGDINVLATSLLWTPDGAVTEIGSPFSAGRASVTFMRGDWVAGLYGPHSLPTMPVRWNLRTSVADPLPADFTHVRYINRHGWVAGNIKRANGIEDPAVVFGGSQLLQLPLPPEAMPAREGVSADFVSDDGSIVAGAVYIGGDLSVPVLWSCS